MEEIPLGSRTLQPHRQLLAGGERVPLGKRALDILSVLAKAEGEIVTKDELLEEVWPGVTVEENALQVHVVALRKALGPEAARLETVRGVGYRLATATESQRGAAPIEAELRSGAVRAHSERPESANAAEAAAPGKVWWRNIPAPHLPLVLAALFGGLLAAWALLGGVLPSDDKRVPLLVQELVASGSGDPTEVALASGITDELIVRLRQIPELQVATARGDGSAPSEAFSNAYLVGGNLRSDGEELRVTVRLTDEQGEILWSQTFDRNLVDLFEVQEQIAANIANALSVPLDVGASALSYGGTNDPEAYAAFVQGTIHNLDFDPTIALRSFERAISLDPAFVQAHASLAALYGNRIPLASTKQETDRLLREMDIASAQALKANADIWNSNVARAWYFVTIKELASAERLMRRAEELDTGINPNLRIALAQYAVTMGRSDKALSTINSRELIDPIYQSSPQQTFHLMMNGQHEQSLAMFDRLSRDEHQNLQPFVFHSFWARVLAGNERGAIDWVNGLDMPIMAQIAEELRTFDQKRELLAMDLPQLRRWAREIYGDSGQYPLANTALTAAYRGHDRLAVDLLRIAFERPGGYALFYLWHPAMSDGRKSEAFQELVTDLGFVDVWRSSGDWGDFCRPKSETEIECA